MPTVCASRYGLLALVVAIGACASAPAQAPSNAAPPVFEVAVTFRPFADNVAGRRPWLPDGGRRGVYDATDVKNPFAIPLRCGPPARVAVDELANAMVARMKQGEHPVCEGDGGEQRCWITGSGPRPALEMYYRRVANRWQVVAIAAIAADLHAEEEMGREKFLHRSFDTPCRYLSGGAIVPG